MSCILLQFRLPKTDREIYSLFNEEVDNYDKFDRYALLHHIWMCSNSSNRTDNESRRFCLRCNREKEGLTQPLFLFLGGNEGWEA